MKNRFIQLNRSLSPGLKKIISNISWLITDKFLEIGLGLIVGIWVARYLGPEELGLFNYAISLVTLFSPFAALGLNSIVIRDLSKDPLQKEKLLGTSFALKLASSLVTSLFIVILIFFIKPDEPLLQWLVGIIAVGTIFSAFEVVSFWFQSRIESKNIVIAKRTVYFLIAGLRVIAVQAQAPLVSFAWIRLLELALGALALMLMYSSKGNNFFTWKVDLKLAKTLLSESWTLIISGLTIYIYSKIDQIMLGSLLKDASELGFYSIAVKLSEFFDFLPMVLHTSLLPKLTELKVRDKEIYLKRFQVYFDLSILLWLGIAIPISLLSPFIVNLMYGEQFANSATILSIYIWGQFGTNLGLARSAFMIIEGKLNLSVYLSVCGAVLNIVLNLFFIPSLNAIGATVATIITYFTVTFLANFYFRDLRPVGRMALSSLNLIGATKRVIGSFKQNNG
jgi:O-antigen/teichoic acid export membrane protein